MANTSPDEDGWSGTWMVRRANHLFSSGYRAEMEGIPSSEVTIERPLSVAVDLLGITFWVVCLGALFWLLVRLPGGGEGEGPSWQSALILAVLVVGFAAIARAWKALRAQLENGIVFRREGRVVARWAAQGADTWTLFSDDGRERLRAQRRSRWRQLDLFRRGWSFHADGHELRHDYGWGRGLFPQRVDGEVFRLSVSTALGGLKGWRVRYRLGPDSLADPLMALGLGVLCIELGRAAV